MIQYTPEQVNEALDEFGRFIRQRRKNATNATKSGSWSDAKRADERTDKLEAAHKVLTAAILCQPASRVDEGVVRAAAFIQKKADDYVAENCSEEYDTGALVYRYGQAGEDYHHTLIELAEEVVALSAQPAPHPDDAAVDAFAAAMKAKLASARAKGRGGWQSKDECSQQQLSDMLRAHVEKGDPRDVANFCMFLHQRGEAIQPAPERQGAVAPFIVGNAYRTQAGELVRFVSVHNEGTSYETMEDEEGMHRYTRRDFGRVTGTAHDYSDPRNTPPLYTHPAAPVGVPETHLSKYSDHRLSRIAAPECGYDYETRALAAAWLLERKAAAPSAPQGTQQGEG